MTSLKGNRNCQSLVQRLARACAAIVCCVSADQTSAAIAAPSGGTRTKPASVHVAPAPNPGPAQSVLKNTPVKDKWALVIGISKFQDPALNLKYAAKDATDFYNYLIKEAHFAPDHVKLLTNEQATHDRIVSELGDRWLPRVANPDDLVVVYISSHGSSSDLDVDRDNFIVMYDTDVNNLYTSGLDMQEFTRIIKRRVHSDRIAIILDACHSGATTPDAKGIFRMPAINADTIAQGAGQLVISSSLPEQVSWELKNEPNGAFTRYLIDGLRSRGQHTSISDAFEFMKDKVQSQVLRERGVMQTPVLRSAWHGENLIIDVIPTAPRPGLPETDAWPNDSTHPPVSSQSAPVSPPQSSTGSAHASPSSAAGVTSASPPISSSRAPSHAVPPAQTGAVPPAQTGAVPPQQIGMVPSPGTALFPPAGTKSMIPGAVTQSSIPWAVPVLVLPACGPMNIEIVPVVSGKDLWGTMSGPQDFAKVAEIVSQKLVAKLSGKLGGYIVDYRSLPAATRSLDIRDKATLARVTGCQLVVDVVIDKALWAPGAMSNKYSFVASCTVYGSDASVLWQDKQHLLRKAPMTGDMKGGRAYFETNMCTELADYLSTRLLAAIKSNSHPETIK